MAYSEKLSDTIALGKCEVYQTKKKAISLKRAITQAKICSDSAINLNSLIVGLTF